MSSDQNELLMRLLLAQQQQQQQQSAPQPNIQNLFRRIGAALPTNAVQPQLQQDKTVDALINFIANHLKSAANLPMVASGFALNSAAFSAAPQHNSSSLAAAKGGTDVPQQQHSLLQLAKLLSGINAGLPAQTTQQALASGPLPPHSPQAPQPLLQQLGSTSKTGACISNECSMQQTQAAANSHTKGINTSSSILTSGTSTLTPPTVPSSAHQAREPLSLQTLRSWSLEQIG